MNQDKIGWDVAKLKFYFDEASVKDILNTPRWNSAQVDGPTCIRSS